MPFFGSLGCQPQQSAEQPGLPVVAGQSLLNGGPRWDQIVTDIHIRLSRAVMGSLWIDPSGML
jgi:hypothetical protein